MAVEDILSNYFPNLFMYPNTVFKLSSKIVLSK